MASHLSTVEERDEIRSVSSMSSFVVPSMPNSSRDQKEGIPSSTSANEDQVGHVQCEGISDGKNGGIPPNHKIDEVPSKFAKPSMFMEQNRAQRILAVLSASVPRGDFSAARATKSDPGVPGQNAKKADDINLAAPVVHSAPLDIPFIPIAEQVGNVAKPEIVGPCWGLPWCWNCKTRDHATSICPHGRRNMTGKDKQKAETYHVFQQSVQREEARVRADRILEDTKRRADRQNTRSGIAKTRSDQDRDRARERQYEDDQLKAMWEAEDAEIRLTRSAADRDRHDDQRTALHEIQKRC